MNNYAVAAGHEDVAKTANDILEAGGNAFDAAVAALFMTFVAEPCMSSAGGGGFATVYTADKKAGVFDFFCKTPLQKKAVAQQEFIPVEVNFGDSSEIFYAGKGAIAVPGALAGAFSIHQHLGQMPMKDLLQPAIRAAREGITVNRFQHFDFLLLENILRLSPRGRELFLREDRIVAPPEKLFLPRFADFLDYLALDGPDEFYKGEIARKIGEDHLIGGHLSRSDFEQYQTRIRPPLRIPYKGHQALCPPPTNLGGAVLGAILLYLTGIEDLPDLYSPKDLDLIFSIFKQVQELRQQPEALFEHVRQILRSGKLPTIGPSFHGSTTHFSIVDAFGNAIALTSTNGEGSGYFVENTDIQLNNMLGEEALLPQGFHTWIPGSRLSSMVTPTILLDLDRNPRLILGSGGAGRIPFAIAQVIRHVLDYQQPIYEAVHAPRLHFIDQWLHAEPGYEGVLPHQTEQLNVQSWSKPNMYFGGVHAISREKGRFVAVGDERRDGVAMD